LLEVDDANDGADIADNVSEISSTLDEFSTFETQSQDNCASTTQNHQPIDEEMQFFED